MSTPRDFRIYRFAVPAHWKTGILSRIRIQAEGALVPERPLAPSPSRFLEVPGGVELVAFDAYGTAYWRTVDGKLQWMEEGGFRPCEIEADVGIARSPRLVIGRVWLWAFKPRTACLIRYDLETLQRDEVISVPYSITDIAPDGDDGLWVLETPPSQPPILRRVDACGRVAKPIPLSACLGRCLGVTYLAQVRRVVVLSGDGSSVTLVDPKAPTKAVTVRLQHEIEGFCATRIDSDRRNRIVLVGVMDQTKAPTILLLDSSGGLLDRIPAGPKDYGSINGATARGKTLLVATSHGIHWFRSEPAGDGVSASGVFLSPPLYSPDTDSLRGWLRAEISVVLPKGATLAVTVMGTDDPAVMKDVKAFSEDATLPPAVRQKKIREKLQAKDAPAFVFTSPQDEASYVQPGPSGSTPLAPSTCAVPLFKHAERWLWLELGLHAAPDGELPDLKELRVIYPEISLAQHVPAIFRGDVTARDPKSGDPTGFFRQLLGVLETTTQGIDQTIAKLGSYIHPATADGEWLDFVAGWLDLPWDDALPNDIKRRILNNAAQLLNHRGTRAGLERLLRLLFPDGKTRVIDVNVDMGIAILGGSGYPGSALPALLSGLPADAAVLSRRAVLGHARLATEDSDPVGIAPFMGWLRIEISAGNRDRADLEALLPRLLSAMIPAGLRVDIRWRPDGGLGVSQRLDDGFILDNPGPRQLGRDARLGLLVLAGGRHTRLAGSGLRLGFHLN